MHWQVNAITLLFYLERQLILCLYDIARKKRIDEAVERQLYYTAPSTVLVQYVFHDERTPL